MTCLQCGTALSDHDDRVDRLCRHCQDEGYVLDPDEDVVYASSRDVWALLQTEDGDDEWPRGR